MKSLKFLAATTALVVTSVFSQPTDKSPQPENRIELFPVRCGINPSIAKSIAEKDGFKGRMAFLDTNAGPIVFEIFENSNNFVVITLYAGKEDMCFLGMGPYASDKK